MPKYYAFPPVTHAPKGPAFTFGIEKMSDLKDEIVPLHRQHWDEVEKDFTSLEMDVAYDKYDAFEQRGQFVLFTVRDAALTLVGYLMCYVHRSNHAQGDMMAREDAMFLAKSARGTGAANGMLDYAEDCLKKLGVRVFALSSRHFAGGTNLMPWLGMRGFTPSAVVMIKEFAK